MYLYVSREELCASYFFLVCLCVCLRDLDFEFLGGTHVLVQAEAKSGDVLVLSCERARGFR